MDQGPVVRKQLQNIKQVYAFITQLKYNFSIWKERVC